jgi:glycosyltransferase involved in cell wall biosynthesis
MPACWPWPPGSGPPVCSIPHAEGIAVSVLRLSVLVPVYNEERTLRTIISRIRAVHIPMEIICIDDCSTDGSRQILAELREAGAVDRVILQSVNRGKGAAIRTGIQEATGDVIVVQDADLEYDPAEYPRLIQPILDDKADAVFGSRFLGGGGRVLFFWHSVGNRVLTTLSNILTNINLTDMETCYKLFRREILTKITVEEPRFGFEPEITAKVARLKCRIYEVGISYYGRTYEEGKKIGWRDGLRAVWCILKYNLFR